MWKPRLADAHRSVLADLDAGRHLWGPLRIHRDGEIREPNRDYVRPVAIETIEALVAVGEIAPHPTIPGRYIRVVAGEHVHAEHVIEAPDDRAPGEG